MCQSQLVEEGGVDGRAVGGIAMVGDVGELLDWVVVVLSETASMVVRMVGSKSRPPRDVRHVGQALVGHRHRACRRVPDDHVPSEKGTVERADAIPGTFLCRIIIAKRGHGGRT